MLDVRILAFATFLVLLVFFLIYKLLKKKGEVNYTTNLIDNNLNAKDLATFLGLEFEKKSQMTYSIISKHDNVIIKTDGFIPLYPKKEILGKTITFVNEDFSFANSDIKNYFNLDELLDQLKDIINFLHDTKFSIDINELRINMIGNLTANECTFIPDLPSNEKIKLEDKVKEVIDEFEKF